MSEAPHVGERLVCHLPAEVWLLRLVGFVTLGVVLLMPVPLSDPNESLLAQIARDMVVSGDWLVPRDGTLVFEDRPIFAFWLMAAGAWVLGTDSILAYRWPSLLAAAVTWFATLGMARLWLSSREIQAVRVILSSLAGLALLAVAVGHDSQLVAWVTLAGWLACVAHRQRGYRAAVILLAASMAMTAAILTKGMLGVLLPAIVVIADATIDRSRFVVRLASFSLIGFVAALTASPWYIAMEQAQPGYIQYFLVERHFGGFLTHGQRHGSQSVLVYLPMLVGLASPWWILAVVRWWRERRGTALVGEQHTSGSIGKSAAGVRAAWLWLVGVVGFFVIAGSKSPMYLLPAVPPIALVLGCRLQAITNRERIRWSLLAWSLVLVSLFLVRGPIESYSARPVLTALRNAGVSSDETILWFYHIPPSAHLAEPTLRFERVFIDGIWRPRPNIRWFITRRSRAEEARTSPWLGHARCVFDASKYQLWCIDPSEPP